MRGLMSKLVLSAGSLALLTLGTALAGQFLVPRPAEAAMGEVCADCHEDVVTAFNSSYHARIWQGGNECRSCHGNTDQHLNDPSKQTIISFSKDGGRAAEELSRQCLGCHQKSAHLALWDMGEHSRNDVACVSCHTVHQPRSTVNQPTVCFNCHRDVRSDANKISHHPIIEGKVQCTDCHNTHGTLSKHMIKAESINQLCYTCHADKRGPWIWEHPPVEENCAICHTPHGSRHETLLVEKVVHLCQNCHNDSGHHDNVFDNTSGFGGASASDQFLARACIECHHSIHGSASFQRSLTR